MKLQLQKEAKERLDLGMYLMVREGTVAKDLACYYRRSRLIIQEDASLSPMINSSMI